MFGYAVSKDGSWRAIDTDTMPLEEGETFQNEQPPIVETDLPQT